MTDLRMKEPERSGVIGDLLIQLSGVALLVLLVVAYATGEEYPHTHSMIGYAIAILIVVDLIWFAVTRRIRTLPAPYTPDGIRTHFRYAGGLADTMALLIAILVALPLAALFVMFVTHALWGATTIDEMHEVVAYFVLGLVILHVVMVGIASSAYIEDHIRNRFGSSRPLH